MIAKDFYLKLNNLWFKLKNKTKNDNKTNSARHDSIAILANNR